MATFVAAFISSTWRVDDACTKISRRPHIGADWGEPQLTDRFLKDVNDAWEKIHREGEKTLEGSNGDNDDA
jgi:hypothetical protein